MGHNSKDDKALTRRDLIGKGGKLAGSLMLAPWLLNLGEHQAKASQRLVVPNRQVSGDEVLMGLYPRQLAADGDVALTQAMQWMDFSWLSQGDSVFIKVASNSPNVHPAVSSPRGLAALVRGLYERGAGEVIVGDQAGVQWVRSAVGGQRYGSTRETFQANGLYEAALSEGARLHFFDDEPYESGYVSGGISFGNNYWGEAPKIARITQQVDHIVYLCRLSSHMIAGYTHGHKTAIGWLRDDSRFHLHNKANTFHEKYVEVNYLDQIRERLRLTVCVSESFMLDQGPDEGTVAEADPIVVLASENMANHDALGVGILRWIDGLTPKDPDVKTPYGPRANLYNFGLVKAGASAASGIPWGNAPTRSYRMLDAHDYQEGLSYDRALTRAYEILGGVPNDIPIALAGTPPSPGLYDGLQEYGDGIFSYSGVETD